MEAEIQLPLKRLKDSGVSSVDGWRQKGHLLCNLGVAPEDVTWSRITMSCDTQVCIRHRNDQHQRGEVQILNLNGNRSRSFPFHVDSAIVSPDDHSTTKTCHMLALKAGDTFVALRMGPKDSWQKRYTATLTDVQFWGWLDANTIGLVTDKAVFHWLMEEAEVPQKIFGRHQRLEYSEITSYKTDPSGRWCALTGLFPEASSISGETQIYSTDKRLSQCIHVHTALLTNYCFDGNQNPSVVLCAASRDSSSPGQGKVHVVELGPQMEGNLAPSSYYDTIDFAESTEKYDFPVAIQASSEHGLMYVVTKYGQLYICDIESAMCLCCVSVSAHIIFATSFKCSTNGLIYINTAGQVMEVNTNLEEIISLAKDQPRIRNVANRLKKYLPLIPFHFLL